MYKKVTNSGHVVIWEPEDNELAARSLAAVNGTGVRRAGEAARKVRDEGPIEISDELSREISKEYRTRKKDAGITFSPNEE